MTTAPVSPSLTDNPLCSDWLEFTADGRVLLKTGKVEIGQGITTALVQIAADELDIDPARFDVLSGHTDDGPVEAATSSSLSMEVTGKAIRHAASAARHVLLDEAAKLLQADKGQLGVMDGEVRVGDRPSSLTYWALVQSAELAQPVVEHAAPKAPG